MPFKSEKQRRYLHANHPEIAKRWERDYANGGITLPKGPAGITSLNGWGSTEESQNIAGADITPSMDRNPNDPGWGGGDGPKGPPKVINPPKGPTKAEIEAEKKRKALEEQQRRAAQYSDFYNKFKGDTKKKTDYLSRLLKNDPLYQTYVDKGLLDWSNIKSFDKDRFRTKDEIEEAKKSSWGYTRPWDNTYVQDDSLYIRDLDKFDPTWTPGWTGDSKQERLNKRIANTIGHEARHQVLAEGETPPWGKDGQTIWTGDPWSQDVEIALTQDENSPYSKFIKEGGLEYEGYTPDITSHELLTRMGDFQSYNNPRVYEDIYENVHGGMPRHLTSDVANKFYDASEQAAKDLNARNIAEKYENIDPVLIEAYADQLMGDDSEDTEGLARREVVRMLKQGAEQLGTKNIMDILKDDYEYNKEYAKGGIARKKYSTGGVLDITGEEEITTEEGNDISLVDESETGVSTLFRAKNGGYAVQGGVKNYLGEQEMVSAPKHWQSAPDHPKTELTYITDAEKDLLVKADLHGSLHGSVNRGPQGLTSLNGWGDTEDGFGSNNNNDNQGSDQGHSRFDSGYYGGTTTTSAPTGDDQEDDVAIMETNMGVTTDHSPNYTGSDAGWVVSEDEETEIGGSDYASIKQIQERAQRRKTDYKNQQKKDVALFGIKALFLGLNPYGVYKFGKEQDAKKQEYLATLEEDIQALKDKGVPTYNPHTDTLVQTLEQEKLDLTQPRSRDEDTGDDGPTAPVVAPVTEEIEDSYAMVGDWLQSYRDLKAKQALSASLQEKWADEREWQQNTMFANSGGLANLFRVKN